MALEDLVLGRNLGNTLVADPIAKDIQVNVDGTTVLADPTTGVISAVADAETLTALAYDTGSHTLIYTDENAAPTTIALTPPVIPDTVTTLVFDQANNQFTYTNEAGVPVTVPIATSDIFITGANLTGTVLQLTDNDGNEFTVDLGQLQGASADPGNVLIDGTDGKPLLQEPAVAQIARDQMVTVLSTDLFGDDAPGIGYVETAAEAGGLNISVAATV